MFVRVTRKTFLCDSSGPRGVGRLIGDRAVSAPDRANANSAHT